MRKMFIFIFLGILVTGGIYYINKNNGRKEIINKIQAEKNIKRREAIRANFRTEEELLLSLKYNLDKEKIYNLINEYELLAFGHSDDFHYTPRRNEEIVEISVVIDNLSKKYSIPKETIANIILDKEALETKSSD